MWRSGSRKNIFYRQLCVTGVAQVTSNGEVIVTLCLTYILTCGLICIDNLWIQMEWIIKILRRPPPWTWVRIGQMNRGLDARPKYFAAPRAIFKEWAS